MVSDMIIGFGVGIIFGCFLYQQFGGWINKIFSGFKLPPHIKTNIDRLNRTADEVDRKLQDVDRTMDRIVNGAPPAPAKKQQEIEIQCNSCGEVFPARQLENHVCRGSG